jgi:hypothetical protein
MLYTTIVMALVAVALILVFGARKLGAQEVTEPLDTPWEEGAAGG